MRGTAGNGRIMVDCENKDASSGGIFNEIREVIREERKKKGACCRIKVRRVQFPRSRVTCWGTLALFRSSDLVSLSSCGATFGPTIRRIYCGTATGG